VPCKDSRRFVALPLCLLVVTLYFLVLIKRFLGNISLAVVLNLLVKPGWVVVENLVQDRIGHAAFGTFTALSSLTIILATFSDVGLTHYTVKRVAAEPTYLATYFPTILPLRSALNGVALAVLLGVGWLLGYHSAQIGLLAVIGSALLLTQYGQFLRGTLQANQHFNTDALLSVLEKVLLLALVLCLLPFGLSLSGYVWARLAAAAFTAAVLYGLMVRLFGRVRYRWHWGRTRQVLLETLPFALITLLYGANERVDMVMLERLASPTEASYYAGAYRWVDAVMMYVWTIMPLFFARFAAALHSREEQRALLWFGQRVVTLPLLLACAFVLFRGEVLFWQFTHSTEAEIGRMALCLRILFLNVLVHAFFAIYSSLLNSTHYVRTVSWLVALSLGLNTVLNFVFLPSHGAVAAALNTLLCAVLVSGGYVWLVHYRAQVAVPWGLLARLGVAFGLLCACWYGLQHLLALPWLAESMVAAAAFGAISLALGLVPLADIKAFISPAAKPKMP
jgi:O-antigen/teichoic acid export membrane protein